MSGDSTLIEGRGAFASRDWSTAYACLRALGTELAADDQLSLATAAYLVGDHDTTVAALERAFRLHEAEGAVLLAARDAHWLAYVFSMNGNPAVGGGWCARGLRLLDGLGDVVERGHLQVHEMFRLIFSGRIPEALERAEEIYGIAERWHDTDLIAQGLAFRGRLLLVLGRVSEGLGLLDEAMLRVATGEVHPILTGEIMCTMIEGCQDLADYRRVAAWTQSLSAWCAGQPDLVPFTGQCAVHRAQIRRSRGDYPEALAELDVAGERYAALGLPAATGLAHYERGEVLRCQGDYDAAEAAYAMAQQFGHGAQPGLALLWLARGRTATARATVRRLLDESRDPVTRSQLLPAAVEVLLAGGDGDSARDAAAELAEIATRFGCDAVTARAEYASGTVLLSDDTPVEALSHLRRSWKIWIDLGCRYEAALTRTRIALAYRAMGDEDSAQSELRVAERALAELGARSACADARRLMRRDLPDGLTAREVEVLRLVAQGLTNPEIASTLFLSHKTVQRHLSNIFAKTGVTSRTAAGAYAFEHELT